jgi:uncharacterized ion transporter superfamily protein YfcC
MHTRRFKILTVIVILLFIYCCVKTKTYISPSESHKISTLKKVIVKLKDGAEWKLRNVHIEGNKLVGHTKDNVKKEIDFSLIESVRTESTNYTYAILLGGAFIVAAVLFHGVSTAPSPPPPPEWD